MSSPASSLSSSPTLSSSPPAEVTSVANMATQQSSDPTRALAYLLNSMAPATFVSRLRAALDPSMGYTSDDVQSFLDSLSNMGFERAVGRATEVTAKENQEESHCVRCHKAYLESENAMEACVVSHVRVFASLGPSSHSGKSGSGNCVSCNTGALPGAVVQQPCIVARHTTNLDDVQGAKGGLVRSCEDMGCFNGAERMVELCSSMEKTSLEEGPREGEENTTRSLTSSAFNFSNLKPMRPIKALPSSPKNASTIPSASTNRATGFSSFLASAQSQFTQTPTKTPAPVGFGAKNGFKFDQDGFKAVLNGKAEPKAKSKSRRSRRSQKLEEESEILDNTGAKRQRQAENQKDKPVSAFGVVPPKPASGGFGNSGLFGKAPEPTAEEVSRKSGFGSFLVKAPEPAVEQVPPKSAFGVPVSGGLFGKAR